MEIYSKEINEIRYYKENKPYANFEYNSRSHSIKFSCPEEKVKLIFNSKNPEDIELFWDNLARKSLDKELGKLNEILDGMKRRFIVKE